MTETASVEHGASTCIFRGSGRWNFRGQTRPDMWSWLEVYPQHLFTNSTGQKEQMSVGVGQNAVNGGSAR